jgi:NTP pyrophosphatase (non-canonical NTP hydrolase)
VNLDQYQDEVVRTRATTDHNETIKMALIGLQDELGEIAGPLKKYLWHGHSLAGEHLLDEMGDVLWYLTTLCNEFNISLEDVLQNNVEKLRRRYPDGFSSERSINREGGNG